MISAALISWTFVEVFAFLGVLILAPIGFFLLIPPDEIDAEDCDEV